MTHLRRISSRSLATAVFDLVLLQVILPLLPGFRVKLWLGVLLAVPTLVLSGILWTRGLQEAGRGFRRSLYLGGFAASMVWLGLSAPTLLSGVRAVFMEGVELGGRLAREDRLEKGLPARPAVTLPVPEVPEVNPWLHAGNLLVLSVVLAMVLHRLQRSAERARLQEALAIEAGARALRSRLAPHFLFNALNVLHAQIEPDPAAALATTEKLARLFREVVEMAAMPTVPLGRELGFVEAYLGLERSRLGERLRVRLEVPEELEVLPIPPLSLQVLVENAVKHGIGPMEEGGEVRIQAWRDGGRLWVAVDDPGPGCSEEKGSGTALDTLRQRLAGPTDLTMERLEGFHRVRFSWPLQET